MTVLIKLEMPYLKAILILIKCYWQRPFTERVKEMSVFVTTNGPLEYRMMPFDMKNTQALFQ
jgi:hypothetical protein